MKRKGIIITLLIILALLLTANTFAYWALGINAPSNETAKGTINIGEGKAITTTIAVSDETIDKKLVPAGYADATSVDSITLTFNVLWDGTGATGANGVLTVSHTTNHTLLIANTTYASAITAGTATTVTLIVTLTEPVDLAQYNEVANKALEVTLTFNVVPN